MMDERPLSVQEYQSILDSPVGVWPWGSEPYRLWSLLDMVQIINPMIILAGDQTFRPLFALQQIDLGKLPPSQRPDCMAQLVDWLKVLDGECSKLPLSRSIKHQVGGLLKAARSKDFRLDNFVVVHRTVIEGLAIEFSSHCFLVIPVEDRALYDQKVPIFGDLVDSAFPSLSGEIASAGRCQALGEHTACVFHLMRCLELSLPVLGKYVGLDPDKLTMESWKNLVEMIEKKIRAMEQTGPKSPERDQHLQVLSEAAGQFHHFRIAWRNQVAHRRVVYGHREATIIMNGVGAFMQHLAAHGVAEDDEEAP